MFGVRRILRTEGESHVTKYCGNPRVSHEKRLPVLRREHKEGLRDGVNQGRTVSEVRRVHEVPAKRIACEVITAGYAEFAVAEG